MVTEEQVVDSSLRRKGKGERGLKTGKIPVKKGDSGPRLVSFESGLRFAISLSVPPICSPNTCAQICQKKRNDKQDVVVECILFLTVKTLHSSWAGAGAPQASNLTHACHAFLAG